jgi:hypothetical protein
MSRAIGTFVEEQDESSDGGAPRSSRALIKFPTPDWKQKPASKPYLIIDKANLPAAARALRDRFAASRDFYERGGPVRVIQSTTTGMPTVMPLDVNSSTMEAHELCHPVIVGLSRVPTPTTLPTRVAAMYLGMRGQWGLRPLAGICTSPILRPDGDIRTHEGYDLQTKMFCANVPTVRLLERPTQDDAERALRLIRNTLSRTFPFADSPRRRHDSRKVDVVDINKPPGADESAWLVGLLTAVCRSSLPLAPGLLITAPALSGAGTGKGLLVRGIATIAHGIQPHAFTAGGGRHELDKRLAAQLIDASPMVFLDNVNGMMLRSDLLAQILTERSIRSRLLGRSAMIELNSSAFVAVTGNGVTLTEDLVRRFVVCHLDARCEDPEQRDLEPGFLDYVERRRAELLGAALTIWRWGRQHASSLFRGRPLGSFETWAEWCRDPLVTLGCKDPVDRLTEIKAADPGRRNVFEFFAKWHEVHAGTWVKTTDIRDDVWAVVDYHGRSRQSKTAYLERHVNTVAGGFKLSGRAPAGRWGAWTYQVQRVA